jgi:hypothetical protein
LQFKPKAPTKRAKIEPGLPAEDFGDAYYSNTADASGGSSTSGGRGSNRGRGNRGGGRWEGGRGGRDGRGRGRFQQQDVQMGKVFFEAGGGSDGLDKASAAEIQRVIARDERKKAALEAAAEVHSTAFQTRHLAQTVYMIMTTMLLNAITQCLRKLN